MVAVVGSACWTINVVVKDWCDGESSGQGFTLCVFSVPGAPGAEYFRTCHTEHARLVMCTQKTSAPVMKVFGAMVVH